MLAELQLPAGLYLTMSPGAQISQHTACNTLATHEVRVLGAQGSTAAQQLSCDDIDEDAAQEATAKTNPIGIKKAATPCRLQKMRLWQH